jgi:heptaprenyl diphosphate synthase
MPSPTEKLTKMALFLALGLVLQLVEALALPPLPLPGVRLGLANVATLAVLELQGTGPAFSIALVRVLLGSFMTATFGTTAFWLSLAGATASILAMSLLSKLSRPRFGFLGISVLGAMSHNFAQLLTYSLFANFAGFFYYSILLTAAAIPTGMVVGFLAYHLCRLERGMNNAGCAL